MSGSQYGSPLKRKGNNINYGSPSSKLKSNNHKNSSVVNSSSLLFLKDSIPILGIIDLRNRVMLFVNSINDGSTPGYIRTASGYITNYLVELHNSSVNFNLSQMSVVKNNIVYKKNNKILKKHSLNAMSLVEGIIQFTLWSYYNNSTLHSSLNKRQSKLWQIMPYSLNKTLGQFMFDVYSDSKLSEFQKNSMFLEILIKVADKLNILQNNCGLIHGDLHSGNIFIDAGNIILIDFGNSYIRLQNGLNIFVPNELNINGYLRGINKNDLSKAVDMFILIESFEKYDNELNEIKLENFQQFKRFIHQITERYFRTFTKTNYLSQKGYKGNHLVFSRSSDFLSASDTSLRYLLPSEFVKFILDTGGILSHPLDSVFHKNNNTKNQEKKSGLFDNNNNI